MWKYYNPNPKENLTTDCTVRAISLAIGESWDDVYSDLAIKGFISKKMPSNDSLWNAYVRGKGFRVRPVPDTCPDCYTLRDFCEEHPKGTYLVKCEEHLVCAIDGDYFDTWDSGDQTVFYYFTKE